MSASSSFFSGRLARFAGSLLVLAVAAVSGCFEEGTRGRNEPVVPEPQPQEEPVGVTDPPPGTDPVIPPPEEELDAGPLQFRIDWDGSTTPTSTYVRGVDAAAAEAERGFGDPTPDSGADGGN